MKSAKDAILSRIGLATHSEPSTTVTYDNIPRNYRVEGHLDLSSRLQLLVDRLKDYDTTVYRCSRKHLPTTVRKMLRDNNRRRILIPDDIKLDVVKGDGFEFARDTDLSYRQLDACDGVVTRCALAIAVTGTIVLRHNATSGRRALTLIPDYHLCIIDANDVVETVPEGIRRMESFATSPITTVSGPSATADIEMTRVKGVHGPRTLDVILVVDNEGE